LFTTYRSTNKSDHRQLQIDGEPNRISVSDCLFQNNTAVDGGCFFVGSVVVGAAIIILDSEFENNAAANSGGTGAIFDTIVAIVFLFIGVVGVGNDAYGPCLFFATDSSAGEFLSSGQTITLSPTHQGIMSSSPSPIAPINGATPAPINEPSSIL
jgi:hypothetical protein